MRRSFGLLTHKVSRQYSFFNVTDPLVSTSSGEEFSPFATHKLIEKSAHVEDLHLIQEICSRWVIFSLLMVFAFLFNRGW
jgi:hypothetical protein